MSDDVPTTPLSLAIFAVMAAKEEVLFDDTPFTRAAFVIAWDAAMALRPPRYVSEHVIEYSPSMGIAHAMQLLDWIRTDPQCAEAYECDAVMLQDLYDETEREYLESQRRKS